MSLSSPSVTIQGLNDLEKNELLDILPEGSVQFVSAELEEEHYHGDVTAIIATIVGSVAAYKALLFG
jgi:hypothetical protein